MTILYTVFGFVFGIIIGSFLNVVIYRLYKGAAVTGYSACPSCRHRLSVSDLVPVISFLALGGRCRYCSKSISWQYPAVELACGLLFGYAASQAFLSEPFDFVPFAFQLLFISLLIVIFTFDFRYYLIPNEIVIIGAVAAMLMRITLSQHSIIDGVWGTLVVGGFFAVLYFISRGHWIGFGDVKLGIFLGLLLGFTNSLLMLLLAYVSGAIVGVALVIAKRKSMQGVLPFGTFLTAASIVMLISGDALREWYLNFIYQL